MRPGLFVAGLATLLVLAAHPADAQSEPQPIDLVVHAGRPVRVALDERTRLTHVGQPVTGSVTEAVYAYDRVVIPAGAKVRGHVAQIDAGSRWVRLRAYAGGNFSPRKRAVLRFDALVLDDGRVMPIDTVVTGGSHVSRHVAGGSTSAGKKEAEQAAASADEGRPTLGSRARHEVRQRSHEMLAEARQKVSETVASLKALRQPGEMARLKDAAVQQLPFHPQYLDKGAVYDAELTGPVSFGRVVPAAAAPGGTAPAPDSILTARLVATLDSSKTPRGTRFEATVTETVFSADHRVILPEGTTLTGEVTLATPARRFHRNGRLRFLFESVQVPGQPAAPLLGELHAVDAGDETHVALDDEGGATVQNSKTRFIAPAVALLSLQGSLEGDGHRYADPDGDGSIKTAESGVESRGAGGFIGMGLVGAAVSQFTRPIGIALSAYGAARTVFTNILGKGREVTFPAGMPIQVRLAPGPTRR